MLVYKCRLQYFSISTISRVHRYFWGRHLSMNQYYYPFRLNLEEKQCTTSINMLVYNMLYSF